MLAAGADTLQLPTLRAEWPAIELTSVPKGLSFVDASGGAGQPVEASVTCSRHECDRMQLAAATRLRFEVSYSIKR